MAWTCTVTLDEDKTDVGTARCVFTDADTTTFSYSRRARINVSDRDAFCNEAIAARDAWQTRKASEATYTTSVQDRITALDI